MTPSPPGDRQSVRWRITAMISPELVALILVVIVVAVAVAVIVAMLPHTSGA